MSMDLQAKSAGIARVPPPNTVLGAVRLLRGHLDSIRSDTERLEQFRSRIAYPTVTGPSPDENPEEPYPDGLLGQLTALVDEASTIATDFHEINNELTTVVFGEEAGQ